MFDTYDLKLVGDTHQTAGVTGGGGEGVCFNVRCAVLERQIGRLAAGRGGMGYRVPRLGLEWCVIVDGRSGCCG